MEDANQSPVQWPCSNFLKKLFLNRNITNPSEIEYPLDRMLSPDGFKNGPLATQLLYEAVVAGQRILVLGDYDTDGATSTVLAINVLKELGVDQVDYLVPNRFEYGYGLSPEIAEVAIQTSPDLVITVDNGITSVEGVEFLKSHNIKVLVTDHHLPGPKLPCADAILNPNLPGCGFSSKNLAGVGVMFYLLLMLRARLKAENWYQQSGIEMPNLAKYLDLVALGTVADVVALDYNNRIFVSQGLARIRRGKCCPGILALMESARKDYTAAVVSDFGFVIAPRLNASGRLDDISTGIECLLATNGADARRYATVLEEINSERKTIEQDMQSRAMEIVRGIMKRMDSGSGKPSDVDDSGFCLHDPDWHQGITGLVASRVRENTGQPVIAFAPNSDGMLTGSARSIPGLHIKDLLEAVVASSPGLVEKFGGHAMAAGLTIKPGNLEQFEQLFRERVTRHFYEHGSIDTIFTDGELADQEISLGNAEDIRNAAPWGQGFPVPVFEGIFRVSDISIVGQLHLKLKLVTEDMARSLDAIAFRAIEPGQSLPDLEKIHAVYQLDVNEFRGNRKLQLVISYFTPVE